MRGRPFIILAVLVGAAAAGFAIVYGLSELKLRDVARTTPFDRLIAADPDTIARGKHIAATRGCSGCHGKDLQGALFGEFGSVRAVAPNLAVYAREHDAATLEAAIRRGVGHDGRALWAMPSYNWRHLTDDDTAALIAYLRTVPAARSELPAPRFGFPARWRLVTGQEHHMATIVSWVPPLMSDWHDPALVRGEYLAMTTCIECHGLDLRGETLYGATPDLAIILAYSEGDFRKLMQDGIALGERGDLALMSDVARDRFVHFTDDELSDLYAYLRTLASAPAAQNVPWRPER